VNKITYSLKQALDLANFWLGAYYEDSSHRIVLDPTEDRIVANDGVYEEVECLRDMTLLEAAVLSRGIPVDTGWLPCEVLAYD